MNTIGWIICIELYGLLGTYEGSMGVGLYYSGHREGRGLSTNEPHQLKEQLK